MFSNGCEILQSLVLYQLVCYQNLTLNIFLKGTVTSSQKKIFFDSSMWFYGIVGII